MPVSFHRAPTPEPQHLIRPLEGGPEPSDLGPANSCSAPLKEGLHLMVEIKGEDVFGSALYTRWHLCLSGPVVSHCQSPEAQPARIERLGVLAELGQQKMAPLQGKH